MDGAPGPDGRGQSSPPNVTKGPLTSPTKSLFSLGKSHGVGDAGRMNPDRPCPAPATGGLLLYLVLV